MPQNFKNFILIFIILLLLPSVASAQDTYEKVITSAEEDCKKIAAQLGGEFPRVNVGGVKIDTYNGNCSFSNEGSPGYASQLIEDVQIAINLVGFARYSSPESARNGINKAIKNYEAKQKANSVDNDFESIVRETSDGYEYLLKGYFLATLPELRKTHTAVVGIVRGSCVIAVTGRSFYSDKGTGYHVGLQGKINKHPEFNHDREVEILGLARQKTEELLNVLDCDNNISSPSSAIPSVQNSFSKENSLNKSNYTQALVIDPPKKSDFQKVSKSDFKLVNPPLGTASATPKSATQSANITGSIFIGKVGGEGELILQLPSGKEVTLAEDKSAFEGERPYARWRDINGRNNYIAPKRSVYIEEIDCHILLEQERQKQEDLKRPEGIRYASEWGVDETIIVKPTGDCSYVSEGGPVRVLIEQGQVTFKTPGGGAVSAENADFGIGYNAKSAISIVEVYNGSITVTNNAGNSKTISAVYGSEIKQIEVDKDGAWVEKIAIPLSQWQAFLASNQTSGKKANTGSNLPIVPVVVVLGLGGLIFFLYRTGKLLPLYKISSQKIAEMLKKIRKEKSAD